MATLTLCQNVRRGTHQFTNSKQMSTSEILSLRDNVLLIAQTKCSDSTFLFFRLLSAYGFRSEEVFRLENAINVSGNIYTVETVKFGVGRTLDFTMFSQEMDFILTHGARVLFPFSKTTYQRDFNMCLPRELLTVGNKGIELHFFRHAKIKELEYNGLTRKQIQLYMGLSSLKTVDIYADSIIV